MTLILFLCAGLEPGRDGVGDYTRTLAGACRVHGVRSRLIALQDRFVSTAVEETDGTDGVSVLRLSAAAPWSERLRRVEADARAHRPDWVSWQMVSYGFHPKGILPVELTDLGTRLGGLRHQVMLHELWIGLAAGEPLKDRVLGWLQRRRLLQWLRTLQPARCHTTNPTYAAALGARGFPSEVLPLFGNVPVAMLRSGAADAVASFLALEPGSRAGWFVAVTFGTLHPQWQVDSTVTWLLALARHRQQRPALIIAGRAGPHATAVQRGFAERGVATAMIGEQPAETISLLLQAADFGIAPHPWALIGKSGVAAAMVDHGLPVLVPRDDWSLPGGTPLPEVSPDPLVARLADVRAPSETDAWLVRRRAPAASVGRVAGRFLRGLEGG